VKRQNICLPQAEPALFSLPPRVRQELIAGIRGRQQHVTRALAALGAAEPRRLPTDAPARSGGPEPLESDPEECLRVLMVRLLPRLRRRDLDPAILREALRLLLGIAEAAKTEDLRYFDAFNCFWEHWPAGTAADMQHQFLSAYAALLQHHLERLSP
jgi:hypothetical protein